MFVAPCQEEMEQRNDCSLKLGPSAGIYCRRRECFPDDRLANVGGDEERNTTTQAIPLLEKLIKENDNETGNNKLEDQEKANTSAKVGGQAVESSKNVYGSLAERKDDCKDYDTVRILCRKQLRGIPTLLGSLIQFTIGLEVKVDVNEVGSSQELNRR